jgi:isopropylmalate/homocitrate/citramalate synthase
MGKVSETFVSPLNFHEVVQARARYQEQVVICDVTLREGEQTAGVSFSLEEKLALARQLDDIGVGQIEIGWPAQSERDRKVLRTLKDEGLKAATEVLAPLYSKNWHPVVDAAVNSGADVVTLMHATSGIRLQHGDEKMSREQMLERAVKATKYTVNRGVIVTFALVDTTRTDLEFAKRVATSVVEAGADRIAVADTVGAAKPEAMKFLVAELVACAGVPIRVHCHNDYGLALANSLAAVEAGASIIDVAVNGLGERSGNPALDELVVALEILHGIRTGIRLDRLCELAHYVEKMTDVPLPFNKPLVGNNAFAHKLDMHAMRVTEYPPLYETIDPSLVGNRRVFPLSEHSGPFTIKLKLTELGLSANDAQVEEIVARVADVTSKKDMSLTDAEFAQLAEEVLRT